MQCSNTSFYNFVTKHGSQLIVSVKSTSDGLACLNMTHMQLGGEASDSDDDDDDTPSKKQEGKDGTFERV